MEKLIVSPGFVKKIEDEQDTQDQAITSNSTAIATINDKATVNAKRIDNGDMNTITTPGVYACNNCSNSPDRTSGWFTLEVLPMGGGAPGNPAYTTQRAIKLESERIYVRSRSNNTWRAWQELSRKSDVTVLGPLSAGGTGVQIPNFSTLSDNQLVTLYFHRYAVGGSITIAVRSIKIGDIAAGTCILFQSTTKYIVVCISASGVITITSSTADADPFVDIVIH